MALRGTSRARSAAKQGRRPRASPVQPWNADAIPGFTTAYGPAARVKGHGTSTDQESLRGLTRACGDQN
eukprot:s549_g6.t1